MLGLEVICFPFLTFVISVGTWCIEFICVASNYNLTLLFSIINRQISIMVDSKRH